MRKHDKERLKAAGRWDRFVALRTQLQREGMTSAEVNAEALRRVEEPASTQPNVPNASDAAPPEPLVQELPDFTRQVPDHDAVAWVAANIANPNVRAQDAPGGLAWALLLWARRSASNETAFWNSIWPKQSGGGPKQQHDTYDPEMDEGSQRAIELCEKLLDQFNKEQAREDAELARRPDAAKIGSTLQHSLAGALERETRLQEQVERLRQRVQELEGTAGPES